VKLRDLFIDIAIYGTGNILVKATAFITMPIYTRIFTPEDYGIWNFTLTAVGLLSTVLALGGDSVYLRYFFEAKTMKDHQIITSTWFGFLMAWSSGVVLVCLPFSRVFSQWSFNTDRYGILFVLSLLTAPLVLLNTMCGQALRNQFRAQLFTVLNIISVLLSIGFGVIGAVVLKLGVVGVLGGALLGAGVILPVRLWAIRELLRPVFSFKILQDLLAFGVPLVPTSLAYWVFGVSDRLLLGKLSTLDQVGLYSVANSLTSLLAFVNSAVGQAWSPHAVRVYEEEQASAPALFGRVMTYLLIGFGLLSVGFTAFAREALVIFSTPPFYPAASVIGPLAMGFVAYASIQITSSGISLTKKTHYFAIYAWPSAITNFVLNILLIPRWGMLATSWTTFISYLVLTLGYLVTSQRLLPVAYEKRKALSTIALTVGFVLAAPLLPNWGLPANLVLKSAYSMAYLALIVLARIVDQREWGALQRMAQEFQSKWRAETV
jgi:O-antigen/teichoic acid export membrane protein